MTHRQKWAWSCLWKWLLIIQIMVVTSQMQEPVEPRNLFAQFDQLLDEESFRQLNFVDTEDLLLGSGTPKELVLQFAQAPKVKIRELDIPTMGNSKCLIVKVKAPDFVMNFALDCDDEEV